MKTDLDDARQLSRNTTLTVEEAYRYLEMGFTPSRIQLMHDHARVNRITMQEVVDGQYARVRELIEGGKDGIT